MQVEDLGARVRADNGSIAAGRDIYIERLIVRQYRCAECRLFNRRRRRALLWFFGGLATLGLFDWDTQNNQGR